MEFIRSLIVSACICVLAAGCVSFPAAPPPLAPPALVDGAVRSVGGALLPLKSWPADNPKAVILALHGMNDYSNAFALPAAWWAEHAGFATYALDQRGFGDAPQFGRWAGAQTMKADLRAAIAAIRGAHPDTPIYVLGHSMGAGLIMAAEADETLGADGLILAAPGVWGGSALPLTHRISANLVAMITPGTTVTGESVGLQSSDNLEMLRAMSADPKVIKETRVDAVLGVVRLMGEAFNHADGVCADTLILMGRKDEIIPLQAMEYVAENLCGEVSVRRYPEGWHMLLRDNQRERVWRDVAAWIEARLVSAAPQY